MRSNAKREKKGKTNLRPARGTAVTISCVPGQSPCFPYPHFYPQYTCLTVLNTHSLCSLNCIVWCTNRLYFLLLFICLRLLLNHDFVIHSVVPTQSRPQKWRLKKLTKVNEKMCQTKSMGQLKIIKNLLDARSDKTIHISDEQSYW